MTLTGEFVSGGPDCVPDGQGGFLIGGPGDRRQPPLLRLAPPSGATGALIVRVEASATDPAVTESAAAVLDMLLPEWRMRLEGKQLAWESATVGESVTLDAPAADLAVPLLVRVVYYDINMSTWRPDWSAERALEVATTLHLAAAVAAPVEPVQENVQEKVQEKKQMPPQVSPARHRLEPGEHPHEGWAAVDFGTTNTAVTLFDQYGLDLRTMSAEQEEELRKELAALLTREPSAEEARLGWQRLMADSARRLLGQPGPDGSPAQALSWALTSGSPPLSPHALYTELEARLPGSTVATRRYAAAALHSCYDQVFRVPPLDVLRLFPVDLEQAGAREIVSRIEVTETTPELRVRVGTPRATGTVRPGDPALVFFGRKQFLGRDHPEPRLPVRDDGTPATTDDLIREALRFLLGQTDTFIKTQPGVLQQGRIDHVVATYPTVAPPAVRRRLRQLFDGGPAGNDGLGVSIVNDTFDEAIAAALFGLMRDFGGDARTGIQAFRARCRAVAGMESHWQQNVLVVDIGGGTTDIALVRLGLKERTPPLAPDLDRRFTGRRYVVTPTLLGSTGHLQLGGELITLRLFTWFKALFADHLLRSDPGSYSHEIGALLAPFTVDGHYVPGSLYRVPILSNPAYPHDQVDALLRTRWNSVATSERAYVEQTFWLLWQLAEAAKLELGRGAARFSPVPELAADILRRARTGRGGEEAAATVSDQDLATDPWVPVMEAADFEALVEPVLEEITELAVPLVEESLSHGPTSQPSEKDVAEPLDRIILTGKSSAMPIVRHALERKLGVGPGNVITWNPADVTVENDYAKLAVSMGACWAEHVGRYAFTEETSKEILGRGRWELKIEVDNLRYNLPADFVQGLQLGTPGEPLPLLTARTPLSPSGEGGRWIARSQEWRPVLPDLAIRRRTAKKKTVPWGVFKPEQWVAEHREREPSLPFASMNHYQQEVRYQLEIDIDLTPRLYLTRGQVPHHLVEQGTGEKVKILEDSSAGWRPVRIVVNPQHPGDRPGSGETLFDLPRHPARDDDPGQDEAALAGGDRFNQGFWSAGDPGSLRRGMIRPLPPPVSGSWSFHLVYPDRPDHLEAIRHLPVPDLLPSGAVPDGARYVATLDEEWRLAVHRADIPYRMAATLAEMWDEPGTVLEVTMSDSQEEIAEDRDPFNGNH